MQSWLSLVFNCLLRQDDSNSIDLIKLNKWLGKAVKRGLKGVGYVGNGEPLAYKDFSKLVGYVASLNLDQGVFTNGFLIDRFQNELLDNFTYVRVSLDAGSKKFIQNFTMLQAITLKK